MRGIRADPQHLIKCRAGLIYREIGDNKILDVDKTVGYAIAIHVKAYPVAIVDARVGDADNLRRNYHRTVLAIRAQHWHLVIDKAVRVNAEADAFGAELPPITSKGGFAAAKVALGVEPGRRLVLVTGGSLGALRINRATVDAVGLWKDRDDLAVRHAVGRFS